MSNGVLYGASHDLMVYHENVTCMHCFIREMWFVDCSCIALFSHKTAMNEVPSRC